MRRKATRREFMKALVAGAGLGALETLCPDARAQRTNPPNIVVIFIDDMGYGDIGPFGSTINHTPHLDRMAREGMRLTSFYVAAPVCSPSRAALMTGCYPRRVGLAEGSGHLVLFPGDPHGLNPKEITIAEILRDVGYVTGCFGKWHLGDQPEFLPTNHGFDAYFGIPYSNDMWTENKRWPFPPLPILRGTRVVGQVSNLDEQATLCRRFTEEAVKFIKAYQEQPFFVYLPHAFVHAPRRARPEFMAKAKTVEQAQIEEVDWSVGQILQAIRETDVAEDTLVVFTSDNGAAGRLSSGPLRGRKGSAWEGGVREPTIAWWPGTIPAGSVCDELASTIDLLPTFARLARTAVPNDRIIDGKDICELLFACDGATSPHDRFFYHQRTNLRAVRSGPWKLFRDGRLYNLEEDIGETNDVAGNHPEVVKRLTGYMDEFEAEIRKNTRPVGFAEKSRTLLPRPDAEGEEAFAPTLSFGRNRH